MAYDARFGAYSPASFEPEAMYLYGETLLDMLRKVGDLRRQTKDGLPIVPEGYYELSREGIVLIE